MAVVTITRYCWTMTAVLERNVRTFVEEVPPPNRLRLVPGSVGRFNFATNGPEKALWESYPVEPVDFEVALHIRGRGRRSSLQVKARRRYRQGSAVYVIAEAANGLAEVRFTIDPRRERPYSFHLSTDELEGSNPEDAWQVLHFLSLARSPNEFSITLPDRAPFWTPVPIHEAPVRPSLARSVLQLRTLRRHTGAPFLVPGNFSRQVVHGLDIATQLLAGGMVSAKWESSEIGVAPDQGAAFIVGGHYQIDLHVPLTVTVDGVSASVERWARLRHARVIAIKPDVEETIISLAPGENAGVLYRMGPWLDPGEQQEEPPLADNDWVAMFGDAIVAASDDLSKLRQELAKSGTRADKIVRAGSTDVPGVG